MLNHARTLLMNVDGSTAVWQDIAEELIDPAYRALDLPTAIDRARAVLFGTNPDRVMLNYRVRQLLAVVHASPLAEYVTALDPRITYDFADTSLVASAALAPQVSKVASAGELTLYGDTLPPDVTGQMYRSLDVLTPSDGQVRVIEAQPWSSVTSAFAASTRVSLGTTGLTFRLSSTATGQRWVVETWSRPTRDLGTLVDLLGRIGEPNLLAIFGTGKTEPYRTFRDVFHNGREMPLRLAAIVLAIVYRSNEARG